MYLLYLDESGNEHGANDRFFVLGGAAVFESQAYFLGQRLDALQHELFPNLPPEPFHAAAIRSGKDFWRKVPAEQRTKALNGVSSAITTARPPTVTLFATCVEKTDRLHGDAAVAAAIEDVCKRFDTFVARQNTPSNPQRGLVIFAEGRFHQRARLLVKDFRRMGTRMGGIHNLADIPYFASMSETRLLQVADFVAHAAWLFYEKRDASLIRPIMPFFDATKGAIHGLTHFRNDRSAPCECPPCWSRRTAHEYGPWLRPAQAEAPT